jgi:hypothetical protein
MNNCTFTNNGKFDTNGTLNLYNTVMNNNGLFTINPNSINNTIRTGGIINNYITGIINNYGDNNTILAICTTNNGTLNNYGLLRLHADFTNNGTIINNTPGNLVHNLNVSIINNGTLINNHIVIISNLNNGSYVTTLTNNDNFINNSNIFFQSGNRNANGLIINNSKGIFINSGTITNKNNMPCKISNYGTISNKLTGIIQNINLITNNSKFNNNGTIQITNTSNFENNDTINNCYEGNQGNIIGTITGNGTISNCRI